MKNTSLKTLSEALATGSFSLGSGQASLLKRKLVNDYFTDFASLDESLEDRAVESEKKLTVVIMESGGQSAKAWFHTKELAILCNKLGAKYLKLESFEQSRNYIMKAKQLTEPLSNSSKWVEKLDWQLLRISIFQNISLLYKKMSNQKKMHEVLTQNSKEFGNYRVLEDPVLIMSGIESLYIHWAEACLSLRRIEETLTHCNTALKIINLFLSNPLFTREMKYLLGNNKNDLEFIVTRKYLLKAGASYLTAKCLKKCSELALATRYLEEALNIARQHIGPSEEITLKYQKKFENWKKKSEFDRRLQDDDFEFRASDIENIESDNKLNSPEKRSSTLAAKLISNSVSVAGSAGVSLRPKTAMPPEGKKPLAGKPSADKRESVAAKPNNISLKSIVNQVPKKVSLINSYFNQQEEAPENPQAFSNLLKDRVEIEKLLQTKDIAGLRKSTDSKGKAFSIKKSRGKSGSNFLFFPSSSNAADFSEVSTTYKKTGTHYGGSYELSSPTKTLKSFVPSGNKALASLLVSPSTVARPIHYKAFRTKSNPTILQGLHKESFLELKDSISGRTTNTFEKNEKESEPATSKYERMMMPRPEKGQSLLRASEQEGPPSTQFVEHRESEVQESIMKRAKGSIDSKSQASLKLKKNSFIMIDEKAKDNNKLMRGDTDFVMKNSKHMNSSSRKIAQPELHTMLSVPNQHASGFHSRRNSRDISQEMNVGGGAPANLNSSFANISSNKSQMVSISSPMKKIPLDDEKSGVNHRHQASKAFSNFPHSVTNNENEMLDSQAWGNLAIQRVQSKKTTSISHDKVVKRQEPSLSESFSDLSDIVTSPTAKAKKKLALMSSRAGAKPGIFFADAFESKTSSMKDFDEDKGNDGNDSLVIHRSSSKNKAQTIFMRKSHGIKSIKLVRMGPPVVEVNVRPKCKISEEDAVIIIQRAFRVHLKWLLRKKLMGPSTKNLHSNATFAMRRASNYMMELISGKRNESQPVSLNNLDAKILPERSKILSVLFDSEEPSKFKFFFYHPGELHPGWEYLGCLEDSVKVKHKPRTSTKNLMHLPMKLVLRSPCNIPVYFSFSPSLKNSFKILENKWQLLSYFMEEWISDHKFSELRKNQRHIVGSQIIICGSVSPDIKPDASEGEEVSSFLNTLKFILEKCLRKVRCPHGWVYRALTYKEVNMHYSMHYEHNNFLVKSVCKDRKALIYKKIINQPGISNSIKVKFGREVVIENRDPTEDYRMALSQFGAIPGLRQSDQTKKSILKRTKSDKTNIKNFVVKQQPELKSFGEKSPNAGLKYMSFDGKARGGTASEVGTPSLRPSSKEDVFLETNKDESDDLRNKKEFEQIPVIDIKTPGSSSHDNKNIKHTSFYNDIGQSWGLGHDDKLSELPSFNNFAQPNMDAFEFPSLNNIGPVNLLNAGSVAHSHSNLKPGSSTSIAGGKGSKLNSIVIQAHALHSDAIEEEVKEAYEEISPVSNLSKSTGGAHRFEEELNNRQQEEASHAQELEKKKKLKIPQLRGQESPPSTEKRATLAIPRADLKVNYSANLPRSTTEQNIEQEISNIRDLNLSNDYKPPRKNKIVSALNLLHLEKVSNPDLDASLQNLRLENELCNEGESPGKLETSMESPVIAKSEKQLARKWNRQKSRENAFSLVFMKKNTRLMPVSGRKRELSDCLIAVKYFDPMPFRGYEPLPETTVNPFAKRELLTTGILRKQNLFLLATIYLENPSPNEINFLPEKLKFLIHAADLRHTNTLETFWSEEITIDYPEFIRIFLGNDLSLSKFIYRRGFTKAEQIKILTQAQKQLKISRGRLVISSESLKQRRPVVRSPLLSYLYHLDLINHMDSITNINRGLGNEYCQAIFKRYNLVLKKFSFLNPKLKKAHQQQHKEERWNFILGRKKFEKGLMSQISIYTPATAQPVEQIKKEAITFVNEEPLELFKFYNSVKRLATGSKKYYYSSTSPYLGAKRIRITFHEDQNGVEFARIASYEPLQEQTRYCIVNNRCDLEKLLNIMQLDSVKMKEKALSQLLQLRIAKVGKILEFKENRQGVKQIRRSLISRESLSGIKITLLSRGYDEFLRTYYSRSSSYEMLRIENIGMCLIKINVVAAKPSYVQGTQTYFYFEITPFSSRTKVHKFIMTHSDIRQYFNKDIPLDNQRSMLIHLNNFILNKIVYYRDLIYSKFKFPLSRLTPNKEMHKYELKPEILKLQYEKPNPELFLAPKFYSERVIFQCIKKISPNEYVLITIKKNIQLSSWTITMYNPRTCRNFVCYMYDSDILKVNADIYDSLFPLSIAEINDCVLPALRNLKYDQFDQLLQERRLKSSFKANSVSKKSVPILHQEGQNSLHRFLEIKFWEAVVNKFELKSTNSHKKVLILDSFRGVLREYIYLDVISFDGGRDLLFEMFLEKKHTTDDLSEPIANITYSTTLDYYAYIRLNNIHNFHISNDKFVLRELIHSYMNEGYYERRGFKIWSLRDVIFSQSDLKKLGLYIYQKIKSNETILILPNLEAASMERKSFIQKDKLLRTENDFIEIRQIKLNITMENNHFFQKPSGKYILMFRSVFTIRPLQMIAILYNSRRNKFLVHLYNNINSLKFIKRYSLTQLEEFIPYVQQLIELKLNREIGLRILKKLKNTLIISSIYAMK